MTNEFVEVVWLGEQAIVFGYDSEGEFQKRELTGHEMADLLELQERHNDAEQRRLHDLLFA